jgi:tetratricopeptide (TPR) repeat protein
MLSDFERATMSAHIDASLAEYLNRQGRELQRSGELDRAERYFTAAIAVDPASHLASYNLATIAMLRGNLLDAKQRFQSILKSDALPSFKADSLVRLGNISDELGDVDEAYSRYSSILDIAVSDTHEDERRRIIGDAYCGMGYIEHKRKNLEKAVGLYREAIEVHPFGVPAHVNLGNCYFDKGEPHLAIAEWERAVDLDPARSDIWLDLGQTYFETGDITRAGVCLERALSLGNTEAVAILKQLDNA